MTPDEIEKDRAEGTPGPWRVGPVDDTVVIAPDGSEVAAIDGDYNEPDLWPVMEANARRIARLPELEQAYLDLTAEVQRLTDALNALTATVLHVGVGAHRVAWALTGAVKVKPLVWFKVDTLFHVGEWVAETPGGTLQIIQTKSPPNKFHEVQLGFGDLFDTLEAVQSAAQAKYEACILAALEPNPDDTAALTPADALAAQAARDERMRAEGAKAAEARIERLVENLISAAASLAAAISLLERSGMAVKKAAPSNRMFDQMLIDYRATLESARAALRENGD